MLKLYINKYTIFLQKNGSGRPEICIDLNGARIYLADKLSSRKNVYIISTVLDTQVLFQNECNIQAESWLYAIQAVITNLVSYTDRLTVLLPFLRGIIKYYIFNLA